MHQRSHVVVARLESSKKREGTSLMKLPILKRVVFTVFVTVCGNSVGSAQVGPGVGQPPPSAKQSVTDLYPSDSCRLARA